MVALCINNLKEDTDINENYIKEQFNRGGGTTNWRVNFSKQKSRAACVVGRESLPSYILKKIDICKLSVEQMTSLENLNVSKSILIAKT